jgi:hypothetical protein
MRAESIQAGACGILGFVQRRTSPRKRQASLCKLTALGFSLSLGCGGQQVLTPVAPSAVANLSEADEAPSAPMPTLKLHAGVDPMTVACVPGAREECNAIDDDCNGVIDDKCGYQSGAVQITVGWDSGADIDLYVTDPSGETLYYNEEHEKSSVGGHLDHDARGECRHEQDHTNIENAYWTTPVTKGVYRVELHYFSPCGDSADTHVVVSVAVGGKLVGTYRYQLKPEERVEALSFEISG